MVTIADLTMKIHLALMVDTPGQKRYGLGLTDTDQSASLKVDYLRHYQRY